MDSMDFIWGELQHAIEMKILEEASSEVTSHTDEKQQQYPIPNSQVEDEKLPGETLPIIFFSF